MAWYEIHGRRDKGGHAGFHIRGAATIQEAIARLGPERGHGPCGLIAKRDNIGMPVEPKAARVALLPPPGKKVADPATVDADAIKSGRRQDPVQKNQCATFFWCDRRATDQVRRQLDWIGHLFASHSRVCACCHTDSTI